MLTGACGYVGSALVPKLLSAGHSVVALDTQWFGNYLTAAPNLNIVEGDVRTLQPSDLTGIDAVIHLAAVANDPSVAFYPRLSWETTALATMRLADMCWRSGARMIYASSVSVYGANRGQVTEDMSLNPISDYNKTKMVAERCLLSYPIRAQIVRPATICGLSPRMRLDLTVNMFAMQALLNGAITVNGGTQYRPSIHIDDMTDLYVWLLAHPEVWGIFNAGFENNTVLQIAQKVQAVIPCAINVTDVTDPRSYQVNSDKLMSTGFRPALKTINDAITELQTAYQAGTLTNQPQWYNLGWMQSQGIKDA